MRCRIFGGEGRAKLIGNARRQQALYQIFRDYCDNDNAGCANCVFLKAIERQAAGLTTEDTENTEKNYM